MLTTFDTAHQYEQLVRADTEPPSEIAVRRALVALSGGLIWVATGELFILVWALGYLAGDMVYVYFLRRYRGRATRSVLWGGLLASFSLGIWVGALAVFLTLTGVSAYYFLAVCLIMAQALRCLSSHASFNLSVVSDLAVVVLTGIGMAFGSAVHIAQPNLAFAVLVGTVCVQVYFVHSVIKIVLQREALAKRLSAEAQGEKMKALGQFTSGVAHDFNNLLTVISGNIELARLNSLPPQVDELLEDAHKSSSNAAHLVKQLLAYARKSRLQSGKVNVAQVLRDLKTVGARVLPANISLDVQGVDSKAFVKADGSMLETALLNLVINARDAIGTKPGQIVINTRSRQAGQMMGIAVADNGPGMAPHVLAACADPFYSTKPVGKGSGLGLSMVKGFAEQSGGDLRIQNLDVAGLEVEITLPVFHAAPAVSNSAPPEPKPAHRGPFLSE